MTRTLKTSPPSDSAAPGRPGVALELSGLTAEYPGAEHPAVDALDLHVAPGRFLSLLGPSGCGKTTTLRMVAGLQDPTSGTIALDGRDITHTPVYRRGMGMVFQSYALFPHMNVLENVAFGLQMRRVGRSEARRRAEEALNMVQMGHLGRRRTSELSGGQQQRVALARALVIEPELLLLDEPLSNLDAKLRESMRTEIRHIQRRLGTTTLFVTHDQEEALETSDLIAVMNEGRIEQLGTPEEIFERPATLFVATFIGQANLLSVEDIRGSGTSRDVSYKGQRFSATAWENAPNGSARVMVRPHNVVVRRHDDAGDPDGPRLEGVVTDRGYTGDSVAITVRVDDEVIRATRPAGHGNQAEVGERVQVTWSSRSAHLVAPTAEKEASCR